MSQYPSIKDENFQKKIAKIYNRYYIPDEKPTFKELCFPSSFTYQLPQLFVSKFINPKTMYKGLLVFHRIGAGKTCLAVLTGIEWYKKRKVIYLVPASLVTNLYKEFRSECAGDIVISKSERARLASLNPTDKEYNDIINQVNERIDDMFEIYSFHKYVNLYNSGKIDLHNSIVIIDEVQNIVSENGSFYKIILKSLQKSPSSTRVIIMSGTPIFDKPSELALTVNLLRPNNVIPTGKHFNDMFLDFKDNKYTIKNAELLTQYLRGYVSYSPGAPSYAFPKKLIKIVQCQMSHFQYESYITVQDQEGKPDFKNILKLSNAFFIGSRMISNISFPNKNVKEKGFDSLIGSRLSIKNIGKYSTKFLKIFTRIKSIQGPAILYSNFREHGGIESFIKLLEYNGFKYIFDDEAKQSKYNKKRYAIWSGTEDMDVKETAKNIYNQLSNINGSVLKLMIISPSGKEGLSLFNTRSLHIMEPYWNYSRIAQIIGRGCRYCSHKALPAKDRNIKIFLYLSTSPYKDDITIDEYIYNLMLEKKDLLNDFYKVLENAAVDKDLFINAKKFTSEY